MFWPVVTLIKNENKLKYKSSFKQFDKYFEKCEMSQPEYLEVFGLTGSELENHESFQSRKKYPIDGKGKISTAAVSKDLVNILKQNFLPNPLPVKYNFKLFLPIRQNMQLPFNDMLASYVIMYYLGNLVRYYPYYLEEIIDSKHSWIIESFVQSVPITFLRQIVNCVCGRNLIYTRL